MKIKEIAQKARSYRRFDNSKEIDKSTLLDMIDTTRFAPSARNGQTLKFMPINNNEMCTQVFNTLKWAGYLTSWDGPEPTERPSAYIIIIHDSTLGTCNLIDVGLCSELINLSAIEKGLGCCLIGAYNKHDLEKIIGIDNTTLESLLVVAIGLPIENVIIEPLKNGDIRYWRDEQMGHHVPKRSLKEITLNV